MDDPQRKKDLTRSEEELKRVSDILERESTKIYTPSVDGSVRAQRASSVLDALVKAQPGWVDKASGEGNQSNYLPPRPLFPLPTLSREVSSTPEVSDTAVTQENTSSGAIITTLTLSDASEIVDGNTINQVLISDGKIDGQYPSGMPTGNTYTIIPDNINDCLIYAGMTFNPTTLATTSRFLGQSPAVSYPESRVESDTEGFLYWLLGYTYVDGDGSFQIAATRVGDIYNAFSYGVSNGLPALLPIPSEPGWLDLGLM